MRIRTLLLLLVLVAVAAFSALNWNVFLTPTAVSLGDRKSTRLNSSHQ